MFEYFMKRWDAWLERRLNSEFDTLSNTLVSNVVCRDLSNVTRDYNYTPGGGVWRVTVERID